jgi:methyl coenzyme M reductase alpha subunit
MTPKQFKKILADAGLSVRAASMQLDLSLRQAYRYTAGEAEIPRIVEYAVRWLVQQHTKGDKS